jgi:hypothetical protein
VICKNIGHSLTHLLFPLSLSPCLPVSLSPCLPVSPLSLSPCLPVSPLSLSPCLPSLPVSLSPCLPVSLSPSLPSGVSNSWFDLGNWANGTLPNSTLDVYIPLSVSGPHSTPTIASTSLFASARTITSYQHISLDSGVLQINGPGASYLYGALSIGTTTTSATFTIADSVILGNVDVFNGTINGAGAISISQTFVSHGLFRMDASAGAPNDVPVTTVNAGATLKLRCDVAFSPDACRMILSKRTIENNGVLVFETNSRLEMDGMGTAIKSNGEVVVHGSSTIAIKPGNVGQRVTLDITNGDLNIDDGVTLDLNDIVMFVRAVGTISLGNNAVIRMNTLEAQTNVNFVENYGTIHYATNCSIQLATRLHMVGTTWNIASTTPNANIDTSTISVLDRGLLRLDAKPVITAFPRIELMKGGAFSPSGNLTIQDVVMNKGSTLEHVGAPLSTLSIASLSVDDDCKISFTGWVDITHSMLWTGGQLGFGADPVHNDQTVGIRILSSATLIVNAAPADISLKLENRVSMVVYGTMEWLRGVIYLGDLVPQASTITTANFDIQPHATVHVQGAAANAYIGGFHAAPFTGSCLNAGQAICKYGLVRNRGIVNIAQGTLDIAHTISFENIAPGSIIVDNGATAVIHSNSSAPAQPFKQFGSLELNIGSTVDTTQGVLVFDQQQTITTLHISGAHSNSILVLRADGSPLVGNVKLTLDQGYVPAVGTIVSNLCTFVRWASIVVSGSNVPGNLGIEIQPPNSDTGPLNVKIVQQASPTGTGTGSQPPSSASGSSSSGTGTGTGSSPSASGTGTGTGSGTGTAGPPPRPQCAGRTQDPAHYLASSVVFDVLSAQAIDRAQAAISFANAVGVDKSTVSVSNVHIVTSSPVKRYQVTIIVMPISTQLHISCSPTDAMNLFEWLWLWQRGSLTAYPVLSEMVSLQSIDDATPLTLCEADKTLKLHATDCPAMPDDSPKRRTAIILILVIVGVSGLGAALACYYKYWQRTKSHRHDHHAFVSDDTHEMDEYSMNHDYSQTDEHTSQDAVLPQEERENEFAPRLSPPFFFFFFFFLQFLHMGLGRCGVSPFWWE